MSFEEFLSLKIPTWRTDLSGEVIIGLKNKYMEVLKWQKALEVYEQRNKNHNSLSAHNYADDYQSAFTKLVEANKALENDIDQITQVIAGNDLYCEPTNKIR